MEQQLKPPADKPASAIARLPGIAGLYATLKAWQAEFAPRHYGRALTPVPAETPPARQPAKRRQRSRYI